MGAGQVMWRLGRVIEGIRRATFGPRRSKKNTLSSRSSDSERNPRAVKAVSRQFTAVVVLEGSGHRECLADTGCGSRKRASTQLSSVHKSLSHLHPQWQSQSDQAHKNSTDRRQREEEEKYTYLPPGLINHENICFMNSVLRGVRFSF
jgi:hypothetical protein